MGKDWAITLPSVMITVIVEAITSDHRVIIVISCGVVSDHVLIGGSLVGLPCPRDECFVRP